MTAFFLEAIYSNKLMKMECTLLLRAAQERNMERSEIRYNTFKGLNYSQGSVLVFISIAFSFFIADHWFLGCKEESRVHMLKYVFMHVGARR